MRDMTDLQHALEFIIANASKENQTRLARAFAKLVIIKNQADGSTDMGLEIIPEEVALLLEPLLVHISLEVKMYAKLSS